ncbi:GNAT family N-acetyltransferase [Nonomuraea sp. SBT364]|uniref:GNAT family N-acetyltransferase n=1 Tax=Nonomuraea sp. SBT364 TaxID=1580530 RepID=UPI0018CD6372|nr:GNAT family N-acetyltransferase [Nonomuraea sp. SBT364]
MTISVRPIGAADLPVVTRVLTGSWGGTTIMALGRGELIDAATLPGFLAYDGDEVAGAVTYAGRDGFVEVVTIDALVPGRGVGTLLLDAVRDAAVALGAPVLRLTTTNDNTGALRFYQRYGFDLIALHRHGVDRARNLKPDIPAESDGIPIRHELELEYRIS